MAEAVKHFIPAKERADINSHRYTACAYCRVSTDSDEQKESFELQKQHYEQLAQGHTNWDLRHIYADKGISGLSLANRDQFNAMIAACLNGEYDLILTKSVSRFARNLVDCVSLVRQLKAHNPPIGVFFETDNYFTLAEDSELKLSILATIAEEESVKKSESMVWSLKERFKNERLLMPECYGYSRERDIYGKYVVGSKLTVVEEEAKVVRFIFDAFLAGYPPSSIAGILNDAGIPTKGNTEKWGDAAIRYILSNERYCGSVLTWKQFTFDIFKHKKRKNNRDRDQYLYENVHEAIITAEQYEAVQVLLENHKHGVHSIPRMYVIENGLFRGFVPVNHHWINDDPNSYYEASNSVAKTANVRQIPKAAFSAFDLNGYQVVRDAFISYQTENPCVTVSEDKISFNSICQRKFRDVGYIQLLIHPVERKIAIRPCKKDDPHSIPWRSDINRRFTQKVIRCSYFMSTLYQIMAWDPTYPYRVRGTWIMRGNEQIIIFRLENAMPILRIINEREDGHRSMSNVELCPQEWEDRFGEEFYSHCLNNPYTSMPDRIVWDTQAESRLVSGQIQTKTSAELQMSIEGIRRKG